MIYFDNSATTCLSENVKRDIQKTTEIFGNPSSLHIVGLNAKQVLEEARDIIAATFALKGQYSKEQIIFTSCGSEADNLALLGTSMAKERYRGGEIITTDSEHPAVENTLCFLEKQGFKVTRIPTKNGVLDLGRFEQALSKNVFLVSMMTVNNETGAWYDIDKAFATAKKYNSEIITHTDAVQGYLKVNCNSLQVCADLITISGHKFHAPKGVGALYVSQNVLKRKNLIPWLNGGGQEAGFRSGTENIIGIHAMAVAAEESFKNFQTNYDKMAAVRQYSIEKLSMCPQIKLHIPAGKTAPHILNFAVDGYKSETLLHAFSLREICLSAGSACSTHKRQLSSSLKAFGLTDAEIDSSIRMSFSEYNTKDEVDVFYAALKDILNTVVPFKR